MPHRENLLNLLHRYQPGDQQDETHKQQLTAFVRSTKDCFLRSHLSGHVTGSSFLLSPDEKDILLTHHKKIGMWMQLGGHADGDHDLLRVSLREAQEESGICSIIPVNHEIFDIDIHDIFEHNGVPAHKHFDIRFVLKASHRNFIISDESNDLAWKAIADLAYDSAVDISLRRMANKWLIYKLGRN